MKLNKDKSVILYPDVILLTVLLTVLKYIIRFLSFSCSGYEGLIKNLMSELPSGSVTYSQPVHCVHWNNTAKRENPVIVECETGEKITADHVIVTVPLGRITLDLNTVAK